MNDIQIQAAAHLVCRVRHVCPEGTVDGHKLMVCEIEHAWVREGYWDSRLQQLAPNQGFPRCLTFLGSRRFAAMQPLSQVGVRTGAKQNVPLLSS